MNEACVYIRPATDPDHRLRVLVTRHWPRGISWRDVDVWVQTLAPSARLLKSYKTGEIDWDTFANRYQQEQSNVIQVVERRAGKPDRLLMLSTGEYLAMLDTLWQEVLLLCVERDKDPHCHRHILLSMHQIYQDEISERELAAVFGQGRNHYE